MAGQQAYHTWYGRGPCVPCPFGVKRRMEELSHICDTLRDDSRSRHMAESPAKSQEGHTEKCGPDRKQARERGPHSLDARPAEQDGLPERHEMRRR